MNKAKKLPESHASLQRSEQLPGRDAPSTSSTNSELALLVSFNDTTRAATSYRQATQLFDLLAEHPFASPTELLARWRDEGRRLFNVERYVEAAASFEKAVELSQALPYLDTNAGGRAGLGNLLSWLGRAQRRAGLLSQSLQSYSTAIEVWSELGSISMLPLLQVDLAIALLGKAKTLEAMLRSAVAMTKSRRSVRREIGWLRREAHALLAPSASSHR